MAAVLVLAAETIRRRILGAEPLPYLVMTLAWAGTALAFTLFTVL